MKKEDKFFLAMSNLGTVNPFFKSKLFEYFNFDIEKAYNCTNEDLKELYGFCDGTVSIPRDFIKLRDENDPDNVLEEFQPVLEKEKIGYLTYTSENYPDMLKNIPDFPLLLYYKGSFEGINFNRTVAFVGSRKASLSAKEAVSKIISDLKSLDIVIVSGLAEGIDAKSHQSAINNNLKTIGVIGSGFKFTYPEINKNLYKEIEENSGIIFSEYPYEMPPMPYQFPQRNRIVTGLSYGTVVAEAKIKSGAMISARLTLENGRELMCIPGLISNPNTEGIYHLLKNGANMVTKGEDILEALNWEIETPDNKASKLNTLNEIQKTIYEEIALDPKNMEDLAQMLNIGINDLMVNLTSMELNGLIKQVGGNYFISG